MHADFSKGHLGTLVHMQVICQSTTDAYTALRDCAIKKALTAMCPYYWYVVRYYLSVFFNPPSSFSPCKHGTFQGFHLCVPYC